MQSAPDASGKIVFSASIASFRISSFDSGLVPPIRKSVDIDAAAATQHAEDDPSPTPTGISESIVITIPL